MQNFEDLRVSFDDFQKVQGSVREKENSDLVGILLTYDERNKEVLRSMNPDEFYNSGCGMKMNPNFSIQLNSKNNSPMKILSRSSSNFINS